MKTSKLFIAMTAAAVVLASCAKENSPVNVSKEKTVSFIAESIETKTAFGTKDGDSYPTLWTENDEKVKISLNLAPAKDAAVSPSDDKKTATFAGTFSDDESGSYTFYSVSPSSAAASISKDYKDWTIDIPANQTPTASSVDEKAQILVAKSSTFDSWPSTVSFSYSHLTAYGKMTLTNLNLGDATISSVSLTATEDWVGRWYYYVEDSGDNHAGDIKANTASKTITLNTTSTSDLWFACAPVDLSGKKITVTVNTDNGTFKKEITWPTGKPFTSGTVYKFSVDMTGITPAAPKVYTKVTDKYDITVDSELIIVADGYDFAISTTQNSNNRAQAAVTKSGNTISNPSDGVQVFKAKAGSKTNTIAFYTGSGYIYAASSSANILKTQETKDANSSFALTIDGGIASLVAQGTNTRNTLQYNKDNSSFACYASASQSAVNIYKLNGSGTETSIFVNIPVTGVTIDESASIAVGETKTLTATIAPEDATNQNVSWASDDTGVATVDATGKVTGVAAGTAIITVTTEDGNFTDECEVTVTAAAAGDLKLTFNLTSNPGGWPTSNSTTLTEYTYTLNDTDYTFSLKNVKINSGYTMFSQPAVLGLPAIEGKKLKKVEASNSGGCSTTVEVGISSSASDASYIEGGQAQIWATQGSKYTYTLTETEANTVYYLYVTNKNAQITSLTLTYGN